LISISYDLFYLTLNETKPTINMNQNVTTETSVLDKVGIPKNLAWGYLGILIFMMGDGLELGWLAPYLDKRGMDGQHIALLFTAYGVTVAIASWFSGVLTEAYGPKKTMLMGLLLYIIGTLGFAGLGIGDLNYPVMIATYALRGFGYPFFAYSFLVWINYRSAQNKLGSAVGWFWFAFTGGLNVFGAYYSIWAIENLGEQNTLYSAVLWVLIGAFFALVLNRDQFKTNAILTGNSKAEELKKGLIIMKNEPKVLLGGIVRVINTTSQSAFYAFLGIYLIGHGFTQSEWLQIWGTIWLANIAFNLFFGFVGDMVGWRNTVLWFGGVGCMLATLLLYYSPVLFEGSYWMVMLCGILWGGLLAGYVPLSALVPSLVKKDKGAAMSVLNLGAGLATFTGPLIVWLFIDSVGSEGVVWILAGLYLVSAVLTKFITLPNNAKTLGNEIVLEA
jgi:polyol permease family